jgi:hypothetical protein
MLPWLGSMSDALENAFFLFELLSLVLTVCFFCFMAFQLLVRKLNWKQAWVKLFITSASYEEIYGNAGEGGDGFHKETSMSPKMKRVCITVVIVFNAIFFTWLLFFSPFAL